MNPEKLSSLIDQIYAAALNTESWGNVSQAIQKVIGGHTVNFVIENTKEKKIQYAFSNGLTNNDISYYQKNVIYRDELTNALELINCEQTLLSQSIWETKELERLWAYDHYYKDRGLTYFNAGKFYQSEDTRGFISIARSRFDPTFQKEEQKKLQLVIPHLSKALFINKTILEQNITIDTFGESYERLSSAIIMLDEQRKVIFSNQNAHPFLTNARQPNSHQSIRLPCTKSNQKLNENIDKVMSGSVYKETHFLIFFYQGERHVAYCFPWCGRFNNNATWLGESSRCMVFIVSCNSFSISTRYLMGVFNFTKAEAGISEGLIRGHTVKELSQCLFVTETTVRFHIKNILKKTETKTQQAAISAMLRSLMVPIQ